jgi:hypothetical protein
MKTRGVPRARVLAATLLAVLLGACSDGSDSGSGLPEEPFAELYSQGVTRYLGLYTPMSSETRNGVVSHLFGTGDGPMCQLGGEFAMTTRDQGSEDLLIFLEGGGACWSDFCLTITEATPGFISTAGINDITRANNPARDWNQVYVPYCDGSLHAGDRDADYDGDGTPERFHRGLRNLSAALDVAARSFPAPRRILLAGNSGGGLGAIFALPLVRHLYPGVPIDVINDSGVGVASPGNPAFFEGLVEDWNIGAFLPASCDDCLGDDGHLSGYLSWQLDQDPDVRRALVSYTQDNIFADTFLQIGGPAFEAALREELRQQREAHPGRVQSFVVAGDGHTFLQLEPDRTVDGVNLMDWVGLMLVRSPDWVSLSE